MQSEPIKVIIDVAILAILVLMIGSPAYFFSKFEEIFLKNDSADPQIVELTSTASEFVPSLSEEEMNLDLKRLDSLNKMCDTVENSDAKRIWELKRIEYLKHLKWKSMTEHYGASERKGLN